MTVAIDNTRYDSCTAAVASLIDNYDAIPDDETGANRDAALTSRYDYATAVAEDYQYALISAHPGDLDDAALEVLEADKGTGPSYSGYWTGPVPLVIIATDYAPYTDTPAPTGNVETIDPSDERSLLLTVGAAANRSITVS